MPYMTLIVLYRFLFYFLFLLYHPGIGEVPGSVFRVPSYELFNPEL